MALVLDRPCVAAGFIGRLAGLQILAGVVAPAVPLPPPRRAVAVLFFRVDGMDQPVIDVAVPPFPQDHTVAAQGRQLAAPATGLASRLHPKRAVPRGWHSLGGPDDLRVRGIDRGWGRLAPARTRHASSALTSPESSIRPGGSPRAPWSPARPARQPGRQARPEREPVAGNRSRPSPHASKRCTKDAG
jgi:hypothetical protein